MALFVGRITVRKQFSSHARVIFLTGAGSKQNQTNCMPQQCVVVVVFNLFVVAQTPTFIHISWFFTRIQRLHAYQRRYYWTESRLVDLVDLVDLVNWWSVRAGSPSWQFRFCQCRWWIRKRDHFATEHTKQHQQNSRQPFWYWGAFEENRIRTDPAAIDDYKGKSVGTCARTASLRKFYCRQMIKVACCFFVLSNFHQQSQ